MRIGNLEAMDAPDHGVEAAQLGGAICTDLSSTQSFNDVLGAIGGGEMAGASIESGPENGLSDSNHRRVSKE